MPRSDLLSLAGLSALSGLVGLRVLSVQLGPEDSDDEGEGDVSPADALATLARSHPALEEVRTGCVSVARGQGWRDQPAGPPVDGWLGGGVQPNQRPIEDPEDAEEGGASPADALGALATGAQPPGA